MDRFLKILAAFALLVLPAHRLPAPIVEESPTPAASKRQVNAAPKRNDTADTSALGKFEGTWAGSAPYKGDTGAIGQYWYTLVVKNGKASSTMTFKKSLLPGKTWSDTVEGYETASPIMIKWSFSSTDLKVDG